MRIESFNEPVDLLQAVLWQYGNATNLLSLLNQKQAWYDLNQTKFWTDWYNNVFNLSTSTPTLFGLSVWSIILNIPLYVPLDPEPDDKPLWGFNEVNPAYPDYVGTFLNFGNGTFSTRDQYIVLTIPEQQFLLRLKYFQLSNLGDITDINRFLNYLCTNNTIGFTGNIYVLDNFDMSITYVFTTLDFPPALINAMRDLDVFPRPAGVGIRYILTGQPIFGFGYNYQNFGNGTFIETN